MTVRPMHALNVVPGEAQPSLAALIFLTRVPVLSYGVRAYVDLPYLLLVLSALLVESRHRNREGEPGGAPVLILLPLAAAWAFRLFGAERSVRYVVAITSFLAAATVAMVRSPALIASTSEGSSAR